MKNFTTRGLLIFWITISLLLCAFLSASTAKVPVIFLQSANWAAQAGLQNRLQKIVEDEFSPSDELYLSVRVKPILDEDGNTDAMLVYLLHRDTYLLDTAMVKLGGNLEVLYVERNYDEQPPELTDKTGEAWAACPDPDIEVVYSSMETGIPSAMQAIDKAAQIARNKGYKVKVLKGHEESLNAIRNWLKCGDLVLLGRVGHGNTKGIMLDDGFLSYHYFQGLSPTSLNGKVLFFNSCRVHNDPLKSAIVNAGVQKFIGGISNLAIGESEEVFKCWMEEVIHKGKNMTPSIQLCQQQHPDAGEFGISGSGPDQLRAPGDGSPSPPTGEELKNGEPRSDLQADEGQWLYFKINVPEGARNLKIQIQGGSGDADLYTRYGARPTDFEFDCRPWMDGNNEVCGPFPAPRAGEYHIGLKAYADFSGVTLTARYETYANGLAPDLSSSNCGPDEEWY